MACLERCKSARERGIIFEITRLSESWTKDSSRLLSEELVATVGMSEKRIREFVAGRVLSRSLFAQLGIFDRPLRQNHDRSPDWPSEIVGSITHCNDVCAVAIARKTNVLALGIDIEHRRALEKSLWNYVCGIDEVEALPANMSLGERVCWVFSAKEAFFKAQFPLTGKMLSFRDVSVIMNEKTATFQIVPKRSDIENLPIVSNGTGRIWRGKKHLAAVWKMSV